MNPLEPPSGPNSKAMLEQRRTVGTWGHRAPDRVALVERWSEGAVVDIGCGGDAYLSLLADAGHPTFGTDLLSPPQVPARFCRADAAKLPYRDRAFETALLFEVLEHATDPAGMLQEIRRVADRIVLTVPNCNEPIEFQAAGLALHHWVDRTHVNFYDATSIRTAMEGAGWSVLDVRLINPIAPEVLALTSWWFPRKLARIVGAIFKRLPGRRRYHMSIGVVATNPQPHGQGS